MPSLVVPVLSEGSQKRSGSAGEGWWSGERENWEEWRAGKLQSGCLVQEKNKEGGGRRRTEAWHTVNPHFHSSDRNGGKGWLT